MIEVARREAAAAGLENTTPTVGDATALDLPEASFDAAINRFAIHHIPVPGRMMAEFSRVVWPGGRIVLSDTVADDDARACGWVQAIERLRDPSHWASLPHAQLRALGTAAGLTLEDERLATLEIDFDNWLARGTGHENARLVEQALSNRPAAATASTSRRPTTAGDASACGCGSQPGGAERRRRRWRTTSTASSASSDSADRANSGA